MIAKCILNENNAIEDVLRYLKNNQGYDWSGIHPINQGRYCIVWGKNNDNIFIALKKAWFEKFSTMGFMNEITGMSETGLGDSLNVEDLKVMCQNNVRYIYIIYQDGKLYKISFSDFISLSHKWVNKEGKEVRSINIHYYERVNK